MAWRMYALYRVPSSLNCFTSEMDFRLLFKLHYHGDGLQFIIVSPVRSTYGGYYGLVVVTPPPRPRPQTLHRSHDNLKNPYRIASIFYM